MRIETGHPKSTGVGIRGYYPENIREERELPEGAPATTTHIRVGFEVDTRKGMTNPPQV